MINIKDLNVKFFTNNDCLTRFLNDIRKYKVLTSEEENELFTEIARGNENARRKLINSNQRFVFSIAKRYAKNEDEVLDYVNEGNIGLMEAINAFDATKGYKFITFAVWYIQRSMNYYFMVTNNLVKRSNAMKIGKKVDNIREKIYAAKGELPTADEIKDILKNEYGIKVKDNGDIADLSIESINAEVSDDYEVEDTSDYGEATASRNAFEDDIEKEDINTTICDMLDNLPEKFSKILKMNFGIGYERAYSADEIADELGMFRNDIVNIVNNAVTYLKQEYGNRMVG